MFDFPIYFVLSIFGATVTALSYILYWISIYKKKTKPSRMTWFILFGLSISICIANWQLGAISTILVLVTNCIGSFGSFLLALWYYGEGGWGKHDKIALCGFIFGIVVSIFLQNPLYLLLIALTFDFWGLYPTIVKLIRLPSSEQALPWAASFLGSFINVFAIINWNFESVITPLYMAILNALILFLILRRQMGKLLRIV